MTAPDNPSSQPPPAEPEAAARPTPPAGNGEGGNGASAAPAPATAVTPEGLAAEIAGLDRALAVLMLVFAFFLASFPATNSDWWMHVATGRGIVQGAYRFGGDPFAYTTPADARWVNPAWLWDVASYAFSRDGAGRLPVIIKAVLVTALAGVMLLTRRRGQSLWIPVGCVSLALLAMSPRLFLQPVCASLLLLGLTIFLLQRTEERHPAAGRAPAYLLVPLFALWANLDAWFLLGPATVALYLIGEILQGTISPTEEGTGPEGRARFRTLAVVLAAGSAACLLNPYHVRVFLLPPDLWGALFGGPLREDRIFQSLFLSPISPAFFGVNGGFWNAAGMAYFALALAGLVSFVLDLENLRWGRAVIWLAFLLLSLWLARVIPFFCVVAGPITALNFQDYAARQFGVTPRVERRWRQWSLAGRLVSLLVGIGLLALAWPGWLHTAIGDPRSPHRVGWEVVADAGLKEAAQRLAELHRQDVLGRGFNTSPDVANYCAWFAPQEKGFFDYRFPLFADVLSDYTRTRQVLRGDTPADASAPEEGGEDASRWQELFRRYGVDHVVVTRETLESSILLRLMLDTSRWVCLYVNGRVGVFGWRGAPDGNRLESEKFSFDAVAFGRSVPAEDRAPERGPDPPHPRGWWERYAQPVPAHPLEADTAELYLGYFSSIQGGFQARYLAQWSAAWAGSPAFAGIGPGASSLPVMIGSLLGFPQGLLAGGVNVGPPAALVLAVRQARQAVAEGAQDAGAYLSLAQAYSFLWTQQEERWGNQTGFHRTLRQVEILTALQRCVRINPQSQVAHQLLAEHYSRAGYIDLAADEYDQWLRALEASGPVPGESEDAFLKRRDTLEKGIQERKRRLKVQDRLDQLDLRSKDKSAFERARMASQRQPGGEVLAGEVLKGLREAAQQDGKLEVQEQLTMWSILTGQMDDLGPIDSVSPVDEILGEMKNGNYEHAYVLLRDPGFSYLFYCAAAGDYDRAQGVLARMVQAQDQAAAQQLLQLVRGQTLQTIAGPESLVSLNQVVSMVRNKADLVAMRGILALERGDTSQAAGFLGQALAEAASGAPAKAGGPAEGPWFPLKPLASRYRDLLTAK